MNIEIRDREIEARLKRQVEASGSANVEDVLRKLLETQEEQDRWLTQNRDAISANIDRGLEQLDRGEGVSEDQLDNYLTRLKSDSK